MHVKQQMQHLPNSDKKQRITNTTKITSTSEPSIQWLSSKWLFTLLVIIISTAGLLLVLLCLHDDNYDRSHVPGHGDVPLNYHGETDRTPGCTYSSQDCRLGCQYITKEDPAVYALDYIQEKQLECQESGEFGFTFTYCNFPNFTLKPGWLPSWNNRIKHLEFVKCGINRIEAGAFDGMKFTNPRQETWLRLAGLTVTTLVKDTFANVTGLKNLELSASDYLESVEADILQPLKLCLNTFQILETEMISDSFIANFTNNTNMQTLFTADFRYNKLLRSISSDIFTGTPNVQQIFFEGCSLESIHPDTFSTIKKKIVVIGLNDNNLSNLQEATLKGLPRAINETHYQSMNIFLGENPWRCDCSLQWLQDKMRKHKDLIVDEPQCNSPQNLRNIPLMDADMCNETASTIIPSTEPSSTISLSTTQSSSISTTITSTTTSETTELPSESTTTESTVNITVTVRCKDYKTSETTIEQLKLSSSIDEHEAIHTSRRLLSKVFVSFTRLPFTVIESSDGTALLRLGNVTGTVLQIKGEDTKSGEPLCYKSVTGDVYFKDLEADTTYLFCVLYGDKMEASPYNCRSLTTQPPLPFRTWLHMKDQGIVAGILVSVMVLFGLVCAMMVFLLVRRHPSWLKGSKRVVVVKHRAADVVVLPKSCDKTNASTSSLTELNSEATSSRITYERSTSECTARSSTTSYVSAIQPTHGQLIQWRLDQMKSRVRSIFDGESLPRADLRMSTSSTDTPPPLPPFPKQRQTSSDSLENKSSSNNTSVITEDFINKPSSSYEIDC